MLQDLGAASLDAIPISLYVVDRKLRIVAWNRVRESGPLGRPRSEVLGRHLRHVLHPKGFRATEPVLRDRLARVLTDLECLRLHSMHVLTQVEQGRDLGFEASMTKLIWSETFQDLWEVYDDLLGEAATLDDVEGTDLRPMHVLAMWSRSVTIWGGSSQVQRNVTAERVLGLPR